MVSLVSGTVLDLNAGLLTTTSACLKTGWMSVCIELNHISFQYGLGTVGTHAVF